MTPDTITSPCVGVCRLEGGRCAGCGRTLDQIARWATMSPVERLEVVRQVDASQVAGDDDARTSYREG